LAGERELRSCRGEDEVEKSKTEEGDVPETGESAAVRAVPAHPVFTVKKQAEDGTGEDTGECSEPSGDKVDRWSLRSHARLHAAFAIGVWGTAGLIAALTGDVASASLRAAGMDELALTGKSVQPAAEITIKEAP
jgi:hypothetical protein